MVYKALYREWRPQTFHELVGQDHISRTLLNAIGSSRVAHAYLFSGPRGTGKTSTAKIVAKAVNCLSPLEGREPCNTCINCENINSGRSLDVLEIDAASNRGIDEIREIRERVNFVPSQGKYKVYIIDEVHMLTTEAFNALLKTLEEPPAHVIFILATTEAQKIPATILSRCQRYDFRRISPREMQERLQEIISACQVTAEEEVLSLIVKKAEGGLRDAISLLDQCISLGIKEITLETAYQVLGVVKSEALFNMTEAFIEKDAASLLITINDLLREGLEPGQIVKDLLEHLRNMVLLLVAGSDSQLVTTGEGERQRLISQGNQLDLPWISQAISTLARIDAESRWRQSTRIVLEMTLVGLLLQGEIPAPAQKAQAPKASKLPKGPAVKTEALERVTPDQPQKEEDKGGMELTLYQVREKWSQVMEGVKEYKRTVHAFMTVSEPQEIMGDQLIITFKSGYTFHKEKVEDPENRRIIEGIMEKILGVKLRLVCQIEETEKAADLEDPVKKAYDIFGPGVIIMKD